MTSIKRNLSIASMLTTNQSPKRRRPATQMMTLSSNSDSCVRHTTRFISSELLLHGYGNKKEQIGVKINATQKTTEEQIKMQDREIKELQIQIQGKDIGLRRDKGEGGGDGDGEKVGEEGGEKGRGREGGREREEEEEEEGEYEYGEDGEGEVGEEQEEEEEMMGETGEPVHYIRGKRQKYVISKVQGTKRWYRY
ncbi:uncharacterized protein BDR25DRAFT_315998 [Lindgomyces ingoldianus]|uniref:Uncharacterized protein n=1 Tax=Lindgomyces ingoldianus TaxID=673940 RepID=A0ACB6QPR0_9PLEO|nr:uncharacterized protein BDR25DRAFT_315998 [Lindgomyces ingoldianus]KAF2468520.1 hypothetical protein BDR25DRAFT_315998 [Lindgomyces ingoldianus]